MHRARTTTLVFAALSVVAAPPAAGTGELPEVTPGEVEAAILDRFPALEAAAAALDAARARLAAARRLPDPTLELAAGRGEDRGGPGSGGEWSAAVEVELPTPWRYRAASGVGRAEVALAGARLSAARARVVARIRSLLVELAAAQRRVEILRQQAATVRGLVEYTTLRVDLGEARELERLRMQVELGRLERVVELARAQRDGLVATLVRLSGDRLPPRFRLRMELGSLPPAADPEALEAAVLEANPELAARRRRAAEASARAALQRALALPSLVARAERASEYDSRASSLAVAVKLPLWNRNRPATGAAEAEARAAASEAERARRELLGRLETVLRRFEAARAAARRFADEVLPAARRAAEIAELAYREGETSILDLLDARRSAQDAELEALDVVRELHLLAVEIDRIAGRLGRPAPGPAAAPPTDDRKENGR